MEKHKNFIRISVNHEKAKLENKNRVKDYIAENLE